MRRSIISTTFRRRSSRAPLGDYLGEYLGEYLGDYARRCWELLCLNNYPTFMGAGYACAGVTATSLFFGSFYVALIFLVLNLLTSLVLETVITGAEIPCGNRRDISPRCVPRYIAEMRRRVRFGRRCECKQRRLRRHRRWR